MADGITPLRYATDRRLGEVSASMRDGGLAPLRYEMAEVPVLPRTKKSDRGYENEVDAPGLDGFVDYLAGCSRECTDDRTGRRSYVARIGSDCAGIHLENLRQPIRFLREMQGNPPMRFGITGFAPHLVDDLNPARHYVAFVVVGYWLPWLMGLGVLYLWEVASFFRYRGSWSQADVRSGIIGLRHGREVAREGASVLAGYAARDLGFRTSLS